jgi:Bacterial dnaA protein helix-turn-helix
MTSNVILRLAENDDARTASDVRVRAAQVRAFRAQVWPPQRPAAPPPPPAPRKVPAPVLLALPARAEAVPGRITVRLVVAATAAHFGIAAEDLLSDRRTQPLCRRRQIAMYVAHRTTGRSLVFIGHKLGGRDHTTILHGVRAVRALIEAGEVETIAAVDAIVGKLMGGANG